MGSSTFAEHFDDPAQHTQAIGLAATGLNDEIGPPTFFAIGHLFPANAIEPISGHARAPEYALALQETRRGDDDDRIHAPLGAGFEQKRDVEHDQRLATTGAERQERALGLANQRMQDVFETFEGGRVLGHSRPQYGPVYLAVLHGAGKPFGNGANRVTADRHGLVNGGVGIVHRKAHTPQLPGRQRFPHPDRAGQADDDHRARA